MAPVEQSWQNKVNAAKSEQRQFDPYGQTTTLDQFSKAEKARKYCELRDRKDELEEQIGVINIDLEALSQLMISEMEKEGTDLFRLQSGDSLSIKDEPYSSVQDRQMFINWIKANGLEDLLSVHYQTMNSMVKERLESGRPAPPGIKVFLKQSITRRKPRG